jgi:two-component system, LytTR family, response regulator LytT
MKILIAEDEAYIAESIYQMLLQFGYEPLEPAGTATKAIDCIETLVPQLAIVDIHIGENYSGFTVAAALSKKNIPFIFLTALYDKETISRAKQFNPAAYIVKPYTNENLFATIELALNQEQIKKGESEKEITPLFFKDGNKTISINPTEISYIKVDGKYAYVNLIQGRKHTLRISLNDLLAQLNSPSLFQVHKSYAVNIRFISQIKYDEVFIEDTVIPLGRSYREILLSKVQL